MSQIKQPRGLPIRQPFLVWLAEQPNIKTRKDLSRTLLINDLKAKYPAEWNATGTDDNVVVTQIKRIFDKKHRRTESRQSLADAVKYSGDSSSDESEEDGIQMVLLSEINASDEQNPIAASPVQTESPQAVATEALLKSLKTHTKLLDKKIQELRNIRFEEVVEHTHDKQTKKNCILVLFILAMIIMNTH